MPSINDYMTINEAADKWEVSAQTIRSKLNHSIVGQSTIDAYILQGKVKAYQKKGGKNKEWIIAEEVMEEWFGRRSLTNNDALNSLSHACDVIFAESNRMYDDWVLAERESPEYWALDSAMGECLDFGNKMRQLYNEIRPEGSPGYKMGFLRINDSEDEEDENFFTSP